MTIAVDVTYAVLAHDISPDRRIKANSCIEISKYDELILARYLRQRGSQHRIVVLFSLIVGWQCWSIRADESGISVFCEGNSQSHQTF